MAAQSNRLTILAGEITAGVDLIRRDAQAMAEHMLAVGRALLEAKRAIPHGSFDRWLAEHTIISARTARRYMRLAQLGLKTATVAELGLVGALAPLSKLQRPLPGEIVRGSDGTGWQWIAWRSRRGGPWFHLWAFHHERAEEVATIKPGKWSTVPGQLEVFGLDLATLRFDAPLRVDHRWLDEQRAEIIGEAHPLWVSS